MIQRGRPKSELELTPTERGSLLMLSRKRTNPVRARRARIVLRCARGETYRLVARAEKVSMRTVAKWRQRFVELRLRGLADAPRTGAPRKISDAAIGRVVRLTVAGWENASDPLSIRSLAHTCGLSRDAVHRIWRTLGLEAHAARATEPAETRTASAMAGEAWEVAGLLLHRAGHALAIVGDDHAWTPWHSLAHGATTTPEGSTRRHDGSATSREELALLTALARVESADENGPAESADHALAGWFDRLETVLPVGVRVRLLLHGFAGGRHLEARRQVRHRQRFEIWFIPSHLAWLARVSGWLARSRTSAFELLRALVAYGETPPSGPRPFLWIASPDALATSCSLRAPAEPQPA